jgi:O-antigen/teichoic acid export membrane protein
VRIFIQIIAASLGYPITGIFGAFIIAIIISGILDPRHFTFKSAQFTIRYLKSHINYALWNFIINSGSLVTPHFDTIIICYFEENVDIGIYHVALQLATVGMLLTDVTTGALTPKFGNWSIKGNFSKIP